MVVGAEGKISAIAGGSPTVSVQAKKTIDAAGKFVSRGLWWAHSNIWQSANRGLGANDGLFDWIGAFSPYTESASAEDLYWYTLHGCVDFIKYGIISAYTFTFDGSRWTGYEGKVVEPRPGLWEQEQFKGEIDSGLRFIHSFGVPYYATPEKNHQKVVDFVAFTKKYAGKETFLKLSIQGNVAFVDTKDWAAVEKASMKEFGLDNQMHMFEPTNGLNQREKFKWLEEAGMVGPQLFFGHFIHTTPEIVEKSAKAGSNMVWQPLCNGRLGSGVADIPAYLKAGIKVGMGVDDQAASDIPDPFENMRMGLYVIRAKYEDAKVLTPYDVLKFHTIGSATVTKVADRVGSLEVGKYADFLLVNPRERDVGPIHDAYATFVLACSQANLEQVYIGGNLMSERGHIVSHDFDKISTEVHHRAEAIMARVQPELKKAAAK